MYSLYSNIVAMAAMPQTALRSGIRQCPSGEDELSLALLKQTEAFLSLIWWPMWLRLVAELSGSLHRRPWPNPPVVEFSRSLAVPRFVLPSKAHASFPSAAKKTALVEWRSSWSERRRRPQDGCRLNGDIRWAHHGRLSESPAEKGCAGRTV